MKFLVGLGLLLLLVVILSSGGLYSTYTYRSLVKDLSWRAVEMPLAWELSRRVADLRITLRELRGLRATAYPPGQPGPVPLRLRMVRAQFDSGLEEVQQSLAQYRDQLEHEIQAGSPIADNRAEEAAVARIEDLIGRIRQASQADDWMLEAARLDRLLADLDTLQTLSGDLPSYLYSRMRGFAREVRSQYRALIVGTWVTGILAAVVLALLLKLFYQWVVRPLRILIAGSRLVAAGQFHHRIRLDAQDEIAELAEAMNAMTERFQAIRDDLDRQVQERTKQVVRSEQLASVGFLAAGVAHEINNPLASIAMCAESLEGRLQELVDPADPRQAVLQQYLRMIQSEAFRCKQITEKLLDFSRIGQTARQDADLGQLAHGVIDMLRHLGKYQHRRIELVRSGPAIVPVNPQEIKQVILNLLTNALDSLDRPDGLVRVEVGRRDGLAELAVIDNGCGMTPEVLEHIFEPFFTRRREGQGTGLGLSISYRIVADHGGQLEASSPGPGQGAVFRLRLPLSSSPKETAYQHRAA
ncbi:MAG: sensor histidine kinase [Thermoguttaceae bacterium]